MVRGLTAVMVRALTAVMLLTAMVAACAQVGSKERALYHAPLVGFFFVFYESLKIVFGLHALLPSGGI
ncbi:hypothetical protein T484DRAFT_1879528 [Baffinella frigidus]|nr:hypothetical protein T484DRAFT_1879528 [Cryptophyta sp. CCMP2293]